MQFERTGLRSAYSLVKRGLLEKDDEAFAKAMIALSPKRAAADFSSIWRRRRLKSCVSSTRLRLIIIPA